MHTDTGEVWNGNRYETEEDAKLAAFEGLIEIEGEGAFPTAARNAAKG